MDVMKFPGNQRDAQTIERPPLNPWFSTLNPDFVNLRRYYDNLASTQIQDAWVGPPRFGAIAAGASATATIKITGFRFMADALVGIAHLPDEILVTIRDLSTGNLLMNTAVSMRNLVGSGGSPSILNVPRIYENGSQLEFILTNSAAAATSNYQEIAFRGIRQQVV